MISFVKWPRLHHPGYNKYDLFCQVAEITIADDKNPIAILAHLISDDEDNEESNIEPQIVLDQA